MIKSNRWVNDFFLEMPFSNGFQLKYQSVPLVQMSSNLTKGRQIGTVSSIPLKASQNADKLGAKQMQPWFGDGAFNFGPLLCAQARK